MRFSIACGLLSAGLVGLVMVATTAAVAEEDFHKKAEEVENEIGLHGLIFALNLAQKLADKCGESSSKDYLSLSAKIGDKESPARKCAIEQLKDGPFLLQILGFAAEEQPGEFEYLDRIRKREDRSDQGTHEVESLISQAKSSCQNYVRELTPFYEEARNSDNNKFESDFADMVLAREACHLFLENNIPDEAIQNVELAAAVKYTKRSEKKQAMMEQKLTSTL